MKVFVPVMVAAAFFGTHAFAGFASGPATPAEAPPAPVVETPQLDACYAFCNHTPSLFGANMATSGTINTYCPADSIARGGSTTYELVEGLMHSK